MGVIADRIADVARRCGDLSPIAPDVRQILTEGNTRRALAGVDFTGKPYAPLAPSTWRTRKGSGPPLAPRSAASRVVTDYTVNVVAGPGRLTFAASWPDVPFMEYHVTGTSRMPRRDPMGFDADSLMKVRALMSDYVIKGQSTDKAGGGQSTAPPSTSGGGATVPIAGRAAGLLGRAGRAAAAAAMSLFRRPRRLGMGQ